MLELAVDDECAVKAQVAELSRLVVRVGRSGQDVLGVIRSRQDRAERVEAILIRVAEDELARAHSLAFDPLDLRLSNAVEEAKRLPAVVGTRAVLGAAFVLDHSTLRSVNSLPVLAAPSIKVAGRLCVQD